jgi:HK97 family phage major capsid protein
MANANRLRLAQDEIAKLLPEIEALRAVDVATDTDGAAQEALDRHLKRAAELESIVDREVAIEAKLASARQKITADSEPRSKVEVPEDRDEPHVSSLRDFKSQKAARVAGEYLRGLRDGRQYRASSGLGETVGTVNSGAYNTAGAEYVPIELYGAVINRIKYSSVGMQLASVFPATTNRLTLPKVGDATASFVAEGVASTDQTVSTSGTTVNVLEMRVSMPVSNSLLDDSPIDVAALVAERFGLAYAKKIDSTWLSGDSDVSIGGLYAGVASGQKVTVAANARTTAANLATVIGMVDPFVPQTCWIVSATGWADLFNVAAGQIGTMVFGGTTPVPTIWGTPVFKVKGLPDNVLAVYGDFQFTTAIAIKPSGLQISAARELLIRNNQTLFVGIQRLGLVNHAPEYAAAIIKAS